MTTSYSSNLEDQVPVFISPRNRVAQLHPQALGSLFVASFDSQGYGGGIRTHLPNFITIIKSSRMRSDGNVAHIGEKIDAYKILVR
jgi:hypothetical protein